MMKIMKGILKEFSSGSYTATVQLSGGNKVYLEGIKVARNIAVAEMVAGRKLAVIFFDESDAKEAVVTAVFI